MKHNSGHRAVISVNPRLWHVNCGHADKNGCYGRESSNNETATGDSRLCRDHPAAAAAPPTGSIPGSVALACKSRLVTDTETHHRRRYAGPAGHSSPGEDHSFERHSRNHSYCRYQSCSASFPTGLVGSFFYPRASKPGFRSSRNGAFLD